MATRLNHPNPVLTIKGNHDQGNNGNQARDSAFDIGTAEAQQDPSIMTKDLSGLPPSREVEFRIDLIPGDMPVVKSPYCLAPTKKQELSNQLKELQEKGYHQLRVREEDIPKTAFRTRPYLDKFVIVFIDDILNYPKSKEEHEVYPKLIKELLEKREIVWRILKVRILATRGKANVVADELSRKEWMKPRRALAMSRMIHSIISKASKVINTLAERLRGFKKQLERKEDNGLYFVERIWVPTYGNLRTLIMNEAHTTKYYVHPGAKKMYYDMRGLYWWTEKKRILPCMLVSACLALKSKQNTRNPQDYFNNQRFPNGNGRTSQWTINVKHVS
ncbi:hypothetical protein Tco_1140038 [Tanacetum coccineum]